MSTPFLSEIRIVAFNFPPLGWAVCNGQFLPINQNQALFSLLGTTYGGNGQTTFCLPNLQGRIPIHQGAGYTLGDTTGSESSPVASAGSVAVCSPLSDTDPDAGVTQTIYSGTGSLPSVRAMAPVFVLTFIIALQGIFPSHT